MFPISLFSCQALKTVHTVKKILTHSPRIASRSEIWLNLKCLWWTDCEFSHEFPGKSCERMECLLPAFFLWGCAFTAACSSSSWPPVWRCPLLWCWKHPCALPLPYPLSTSASTSPSVAHLHLNQISTASAYCFHIVWQFCYNFNQMKSKEQNNNNKKKIKHQSVSVVSINLL